MSLFSAANLAATARTAIRRAGTLPLPRGLSTPVDDPRAGRLTGARVTFKDTTHGDSCRAQHIDSVAGGAIVR